MIKPVAKEMLEAEEEDATVELEILCGTVADLLDDRSDKPGVSGQQVQAQLGMIQPAQDRADRKKALEAKPPKQIPFHSEVCPLSHPQSP